MPARRLARYSYAEYTFKLEFKTQGQHPSSLINAYLLFYNRAAALNISVVRTGYFGLVTGTCFAEMGHTVVCVEFDAEKIHKVIAAQMAS